MSTLTIRNLDEDVKARLRVRAAENGRSMEAEVRAILRDSLATGAAIATRNARDFEYTGVTVIDPRTAPLASN